MLIRNKFFGLEKNMNITFGIVSLAVLEGAALAMDAFSVSLANGLNEPCMKKKKLFGIAVTFAVFQAIMPLIGWLCVHTAAETFSSFERFIPWIALFLLLFIGGKMLIDGIRGCGDGMVCAKLTLGTLMAQGVATSIDALSVGFTISEYNKVQAVVSALIIALVTFVICSLGLVLGRKFGTKLAGKAGIFGGVILIVIGIKIFLEGVVL